MGSTESQEKGGVEEVSKEKKAIELWRKIKRYSSLIARLKIAADKNAMSRNPRRVLDIQKDVDSAWWERMVVMPDDPKKKWFDLFIAFVMIADLVVSGYTLFVNNAAKLGLYVLTSFLFIDMGLRFVQSYLSGTHKVIQLRQIVVHYLLTYFILDLVATFPFFIFEINLIMFRFVRLIRFQEASSRIVEFFSHRIIEALININKATLAAIQKLLKFIIVLIVFLHIFACAWVDLGRKEDGWVKARAGYLSDTGDGTVYLASLYWAVTTFACVGYGDIAGANTDDYLFTMGVFLFGVGMFSYLLGNVNSLVAQLNFEENLKSRQAQELEDWLLHLDRAGKSKHISAKQCKFITTYLENYWKKNIKGIDKDSEFVMQLPPCIRKTLFTKHLFENVHKCFQSFFVGLHSEFVKQLILKMEYFRVMKENDYDLGNLVVMKAGKLPKSIFFVLDGIIQISSVDEMTCYINLSPGGVFGESYALFGTPSSYSLLHKTRVKESGSPARSEPEAYKVSTEDYFAILSSFPETLSLFRGDAMRKRRIYRKLKREFLSNCSEIKNIVEERRGNEAGGLEDYSASMGKGKMSDLLFAGRQSSLNHNEMLLLEYEYNSEEEFGDEDIFVKRATVEPNDTLKERMKLLEQKMDVLKTKLDVVDEQTGRFTSRLGIPP